MPDPRFVGLHQWGPEDKYGWRRCQRCRVWWCAPHESSIVLGQSIAAVWRWPSGLTSLVAIPCQGRRP